MDLPQPERVPWAPIPKILHSEETGEPFERCSVCGGDLLDEGTGYLIEKGRVKGETAFEYAICFGCHDGIRQELSEASQRRIEHYFGERVDLVERQRRMSVEHPADWEAHVSHCILSGEPLGEEYQLMAQCDGGDVIFAYLPYAINASELENLRQVLSRETRERLDDFVADVLGVPGDGQRLPVWV